VSKQIDYLFYILRQHVKVAQEAKEIGYGDDLLPYSIRVSEEIIKEIEELICLNESQAMLKIIGKGSYGISLF
jgi:hypothetical protein